MVDKNSSIKPIFKPLELAKETLTRATEIPFEAFSSIIGAPVTRILTPGTTEEKREARKEELAQEDQIREEMLKGININEEGGPTRVEEIQDMNPGSPLKDLNQLKGIVKLEEDLKDMGYPEVTLKGEFDKGREFIFGPEFDVHKAVADGSLRLSEANGQQLGDYFFGILTAADVLTLGVTSPVRAVITKALDEKNFKALKNIASKFFPDKEAKDVSLNILDDIDITKGKGKFQLKKVAPKIDKINEVVKKIKAGELEPNLGLTSYGISKALFNRALNNQLSFDMGQYLDLPLDEIQQLIASKKSLRKRSFEKNFKDIEEYINKADAESLTNPEMADLFDVNIDMIKRNFSSKPEYKSKFIQSKYTTPSDNYSFEKILKENQEELGIKEVRKEGNKDRAEYLLFDGLFRSTSNKQLGLSNNVARSEAAKVFMEYMKKEKPNWRVEYRDELNNLAYLDQQRAVANKTITSMFNDYAKKYPEQFANENLTEYKLQISHNFPLRGDPKFLGGSALDAARLIYSRTNNVHHAKIESQVLKIKNDVGKTGEITEEQLKKLEELDKKAKKLGTLYFTDIGGEIKYIGEKKSSWHKHFSKCS
jgi:hypothetical protein